jgi:chloramphenicol 3-O-phosphotransferase
MIFPLLYPSSSRLIVVLNGASSSGKSEICQAILQLDPNIRCISVDEFLAIHGYAGHQLIGVVRSEGIGFIHAFHRYIKEESQQYQLLIVDHVVGECKSWVDDLKSQCGHIPLLWVKVTCREDTLCKREIQRSDRKGDIAHALRQARSIHRFIEHYALELDSSQALPDELAQQLLSQLATQRSHV